MDETIRRDVVLLCGRFRVVFVESIGTIVVRAGAAFRGAVAAAVCFTEKKGLAMAATAVGEALVAASLGCRR